MLMSKQVQSCSLGAATARNYYLYAVKWAADAAGWPLCSFVCIQHTALSQ